MADDIAARGVGSPRRGGPGVFGRLATPGFWVPGRTQAVVFSALVVLGLCAWALGTPSVAAPLFGEAFYGMAFGFPFYFGATLYALFSFFAGSLFPRCFYLWGVALLLPRPFAGVALGIYFESVLGADIVWGGAGAWGSFVFAEASMAIGLSLVATALSALGALAGLLARRLPRGRGCCSKHSSPTARPGADSPTGHRWRRARDQAGLSAGSAFMVQAFSTRNSFRKPRRS